MSAAEDTDKTLNCFEWLQCLQECGILLDGAAGGDGGGGGGSSEGGGTSAGDALTREKAIAIFVLANAEEWNEHLHCSDELAGEAVQMTYQEFAEALVGVADVKVAGAAPLRDKLRLFLEEMMLPNVPAQCKDKQALWQRAMPGS